MSASSRVIKLTTKTALKKHWVSAIITSTIAVLIYFICKLISSVLSIVIGNVSAMVIFYSSLFFLILPIGLGLLRYFWRILFSVCDNPMSIFYYFSKKELYFKAIKLEFLILIRALGFAAILYLPAIAVWIVSNNFIYDALDLPIPMWSANLNYVLSLLRTTASAVLFFAMVKFYLAPMLFVADDDIDVDEALLMSKVISKKTALDFIFLAFSFIGWILLSFLYVPTIFILPYILTAYLVHSRFSVAEYNKHIQQNTKSEFPSFMVGGI